MSVLTAIIQAVFQAITFIFPISESGHSSMFHDFAGRNSGDCSAITGIIHIGIAIGIVLAMYKLFLTLFKEFFKTLVDLFNKRLKAAEPRPARRFMYCTLLSFVPMILWLIPTGKNGLLFNFLRKTGFNGTLLDDGIFFLLSGALVLLAARQIRLSKNHKNINIACSLIVGFTAVLLVPVSGLSLTGGIFCLLILLGVSKKLSFRYAFVISVPVLAVMGIIEICVSVTAAKIAEIIIGLILSICISFLCVSVLRWIIENAKIKHFGYYDIGIGVITLVIGVFELLLK